MQKEPESARSPGALRTPSASPVSSRLVEGHAAAGDHLAVGDQLVAGLDRDHVAGDDLLGAAAASTAPSRMTLACGATRTASSSRVAFAFSSWRIPM